MASNLVSDGDGPLRRRRRPALSCLECRRRKIKCDQKSPCGQCIPRRLTCLFSPSAAPATATATAAAAAATNHQWRTGTSLPTPSSTNPASLDHYPETFPIAEPPQFRRRPSLTRPGSGGHDAARTIESLVHRVQNLEQLLSQSTSKTPANLGSSSAAETTPQQVRGTLSKTRLFGQSHWMTPLEQVLKANCLA